MVKALFVGERSVINSVLVILCLVLLTGCQLLPKEEILLAPPLIVPEEITYQTVMPRKGRLEEVLAGTAYFVPSKIINYKYKNSGSIFGGFHVNPGDRVNEGDVLATLITEELSKAIELKRLEVENLDAMYHFKKETNVMNLEMAKKELAVMEALEYPANEIKKQSNLVKSFELERDYTLKIDENSYKIASIALNDLIEKTKDSELIAEFAGVVTYVAAINEGDGVNAYSTMVTVADPSQMQLQYTGSMASSFALNMPVKVNTSGFELYGKVVFTPAMAPKEQVNELKNIVKFDVEDMPEVPIIGQAAKFSVLLDEVDDAIIVPRKVLKKIGNKEVIYSLEDGIRVENYVKMGVQGTSEVEILSGIDLDDLLIME